MTTLDTSLPGCMARLTERLQAVDTYWTEHRTDDLDVHGSVRYDKGYHDALVSVLDWVLAADESGEDPTARVEHEVECYLDNVEDWIKEVPACEADVMAGSLCILPYGHEGDHRVL